MTDNLTLREIDVTWLMAEGLSNKLIADKLDLSEHTVKFHVNNICRKLGTRSRTRAAVAFVLSQGDVARARLSMLPPSSCVVAGECRPS